MFTPLFFQFLLMSSELLKSDSQRQATKLRRVRMRFGLLTTSVCEDKLRFDLTRSSGDAGGTENSASAARTERKKHAREESSEWSRTVKGDLLFLPYFFWLQL